MEKSVRDREEKRGLQDFESMESLKSRFKDIGMAFKSWGKLHASFGFGNKRVFQSCGKLEDVSFDPKLQSRRIDLHSRRIDNRGFQPCGKLKDVIEIAPGFQPCGKLKDVSFDKKRSRRSESERFKSERNRMSELVKSEECETPPPESCKTEIDVEAFKEESRKKIGERSGKCESSKSEIDGEDSDNDRLYHTFGLWLDGVQVDGEEDSDKEGLYQTFGCWVDDDEVAPGMPELTWRSDLYNLNDSGDYRKMGRVFKRWRFRVIWGDDGCYPSSGEKMRLVYCCPSSRQEMALIYLKWIAKVLGSKQRALDSLVSFTDTYFICQGISFDKAHLFKRFVNIYCVYPVIYEGDVQDYDTKEKTPIPFTNEKERAFCCCKLDEEWPEDPSAISPRYNRYWRGYSHM